MQGCNLSRNKTKRNLRFIHSRKILRTMERYFLLGVNVRKTISSEREGLTYMEMLILQINSHVLINSKTIFVFYV